MTVSPDIPAGAEGTERWPFRQALVGSGLLVIGEIAARGLAFISVALLTRRLGPEVFGIVGFATAIAGVLAIAVNNGVGEIAARDIAADPSNTVRIYSAAATVRVALAIAAWGVVLVIALVLPKAPEVRAVVALTGISFLATAFDPSWALKAQERAAAVMLLIVVTQATYAVGVFFLVDGPPQVALVPVVQFGSELLFGVTAMWLMLGRHLPVPDWRLGRALLSRARFLTASRLARGFTVSFDMLMLGLVGAAAELGIYAASYRVLFLLMVLGSAIGAAFLPVITRANSAGPRELKRATSAALTVALAVGAPMAVGAALIAPDVLQIMFGPAYVSGATALRLLMLAGGCYIVHSTMGQVFLARDQTRSLSGIHAVAAVLTVGLNLWAIPRHGMAGAGAATLTAEGFTALAAVVILGRTIGLSSRLPLAIIAATGLMATAVAALSGQALAVRIIAGAAVYAVGLIALGGAQLRGIARLVVARPGR